MSWCRTCQILSSYLKTIENHCQWTLWNPCIHSLSIHSPGLVHLAYSCYWLSSHPIVLCQTLALQKEKKDSGKTFWFLCPSMWRYVGPHTCHPANAVTAITTTHIHSFFLWASAMSQGPLQVPEIQLWTNQFLQGVYILREDWTSNNTRK